MASDILKALALTANVTTHVQKLDEAWVRRVDRSTLNLIAGAPMVVISEGGMFAMVNRLDKPEAREFQRWVNGEVLPSIRKTGAYALADHGREAMPLPMDIADAMYRFCIFGAYIRKELDDDQIRL